MKVVVQIPCFNEASTLADVIHGIPMDIPGVSTIEILVIDDGSADGTSDVALQCGASKVIRNESNLGLARSFSLGLEAALAMGADIIVNTDGDNQYESEDISNLVAPIINGHADIVVGDRGGMQNENFGLFKRCLQVFGSAVVKGITGLNIQDSVSGFRALSRSSAKQLNIVSDFSYTIEMLVQASSKRLAVVSTPIRSNPKTRESRLFSSVPQFIRMSVVTLIRSYVMYKPLRVFGAVSALALIAGAIPVARFLFYFYVGQGEGHVQSLILGSMLIILGVLVFMVGLVADIISFNRKLIEKNIALLRSLEEKVDLSSGVDNS